MLSHVHGFRCIVVAESKQEKEIREGKFHNSLRPICPMELYNRVIVLQFQWEVCRVLGINVVGLMIVESQMITSEDIFLRIQERRVPSTGSLICSARIVETSRSTLLANSTSLVISVFACKSGASLIVCGFLANDASVFPNTKSWGTFTLHNR